MATRLEGTYPNIRAINEGTFKEAFRDAKNAGKKTFEWQGKRYTTETQEERTQAAYKDDSRRQDVAPKREQTRSAEVPAPMGEGPDVKPPTRGERLREGLSDTAAKTLAALGVAGGAYGAARVLRAEKAGREAAAAAAKMRETSPILRRSGEGVEEATKRARAEAAREPQMTRSRQMKADEAAAEFSKPQAREATKETGRRFTAEQEMEAATSAARGAASRKQIAENRAGRAAAAEEAKKQRMMQEERAQRSVRSRTREEDKTEYAKGGMAKKKQGYAKGGAVMANCGASMKPQQRKK